MSNDSFKAAKTLSVGAAEYSYFDLKAAGENGLGDVSRLPYSLKVLLENMLRHEDGVTVGAKDVQAVAGWLKDKKNPVEIAYRPARVLMQDFTGVPAVVDLAAMRAAMKDAGGDLNKVNPLSPVDLVIDHSVMIDSFGQANSLAINVDREYERNGERYTFLKWGQDVFDNFRVVPPGTGICHQVNLEYLAQTVWTKVEDGKTVAYPDTLVGTDSHTTMINGMAVLGWGVGGIEAEAAMLGQPISMLIPEVVGFKLTGKLAEGITATDLVLVVVQMLREKGVVGKFVEFYGPGLDELPLADRATIANMAPEYGATCGFFPVDGETIRYLTMSSRDADRIALVEAYSKAQGMWRDADAPDPVFTDTLELDMGTVEASLSGPKRPQDRVPLKAAAPMFADVLKSEFKHDAPKSAPVAGMDHDLSDGDVVIAAITSCTNTSNPSVMIGAGLVARNAVAKGLKVKPWVKTSLAPGSKVVSDYLVKASLQDDLDTLGFNLVGYGCTTCIGNSGPLLEPVSDAINAGDLVACSVLSGNRNFEGRVNPHVRANYLASPPLVVAYAIAGSMNIDITTEPLGTGSDGEPVYLKDIWPSSREIADTIAGTINADMFKNEYANVFTGDENWKDIETEAGLTYSWDATSTYVKHPPYFENLAQQVGINPIEGARLLGLFADSITTDHISPAGAIKGDSPAGTYLRGHQVPAREFNSYGSRRGNHEVMMRGTFANIRIKNQMVPGVEGGESKHYPSGDQASIYDVAMRYADEGVPLIVVAGKEYGTGSSRDWAAKGTKLLGIKAVIVESFERIHRSNLVGMGVLPLQFKDGDSRETLGLKGDEMLDIIGLGEDLQPRRDLGVRITYGDGSTKEISVLCRIDTVNEIDYFRSGGILNYVLQNMIDEAA